MMTMEQQARETFQSILHQHYNQLETSDLLQKIREKAWQHFLKVGLPTRQSEVFHSLRLRALYSKEYRQAEPKSLSAATITPHILPECKESVLVFINGFFAPAYSKVAALSKKIVFSSLSDAMRTYSGFLNGQWSRALKDESDPFALCNLALQRSGLFLYIPPKNAISTPIQLLHLIDTDNSPTLILPRLQLFLGAGSHLTLLSTHSTCEGIQCTINSVLDATIEEDAGLNYSQICWDMGERAWHLDAFRATQKRNSSLKVISMTNGAETVRNDYKVTLTGENSETSLNEVWMLDAKREAHAHVLIDHEAPHCRSIQLFKGALDDASRSSFEGKILVRQRAQKTEAYQLNNNLLLSDSAHTDSKPNLEIFADDVKASHGSTVGQLDSEQIFYMKTRGYSESAARNLLVFGFCQEVLDQIPIASLHKIMRARASKFK